MIVVLHRKKRKGGRGGPMGIRCVQHHKEAYRSRQAAVNALARYATNRSGDRDYYPRRMYHNTECGFWHLTSRL